MSVQYARKKCPKHPEGHLFITRAEFNTRNFAVWVCTYCKQIKWQPLLKELQEKMLSENKYNLLANFPTTKKSVDSIHDYLLNSNGMSVRLAISKVAVTISPNKADAEYPHNHMPTYVQKRRINLDILPFFNMLYK